MSARTVHEQALKNSSDKCLRNDPNYWTELVTLFSKGLSENRYSRAYLDVLYQNSWQVSEMDNEHVYGFGLLHAALLNGSVSQVRVAVHAMPLSDRKAAENNRLLENISEPFTASFAGGLGDDDGSISWNETIRTEAVIGHDDLTKTRRTVLVEPGSAPLEVGYTRISRTMLHLAQEGRLARWPYGQDYVTLLIVVDRKTMPFGRGML